MSGPPHEIETFVDEPRARELEDEPALGELFADRYRIERRIGRGSMGTVYAAHDRVVDERVALKLLATPSERALERFRREVRLARRVTHRNAARTFDLGQYAGVHFITMELVEGQSLRTRIDEEGALPAPLVAEVGRQLCHGLHAAHEVDVIHRDLKPANVLIDARGRAVITDFGIAWSIGEDGQAQPQPAPVAGTPAYMAPEQVVGEPLDPRADLYALGVMMYELLTGQTPWTGNNRVEVAMARLHHPVPDPRAVQPLVPEAIARLVMRCLDRAPELRPRSAADLAGQLAALVRDCEGPTGSEPEPGKADEKSGGTSSTYGPFVATSPGERALAVLPFRYRGPQEESYLADALTEELIDLLAMTRGLRVSASGATAQFRDDRDARRVGATLGVDAVVDGTIIRSEGRVRIVPRLIDVSSGFQRWSERFEGGLEDVFELQDRMAKRIAEALRVELTLLRHSAVAPARAVELYLRGRALSREDDPSGKALEEAIESYDAALALAPSFAPAMAGCADATLRRWFIAPGDAADRWASAARNAVEQARTIAPEIAETHLAAARLSVAHGEFRSAAIALTRALEIAPTYAAAHEYLGILQCDAGRSKEGVEHIELARELDPSLSYGAFAILRHYAMAGDTERYESNLAAMQDNPRVPSFGVGLFEVRFALWNNDRERANRVLRAATSRRNTPIFEVLDAVSKALDPYVGTPQLVEALEHAVNQAGNPRLRTAWRQLAVEVLSWRGAHDEALEQLALADAEAVLLDADWLEACPMLRAICERDEFQRIRARVRARADEIWKMGRSRGRGPSS